MSEVDAAAPDQPTAVPAWLLDLYDTQGRAIYRYCFGMVGGDRAADLLLELLVHVRQQMPADADDMQRLATLRKVAHNRAMAAAREQPRPPVGTMRAGHSGEPDDPEAQMLVGMVGVRPFGRDVLLMREVSGGSTSELAAICGAPVHRVTNRIARAWRILDHYASTEGASTESSPLRRPSGQRLGSGAEQWAAIRQDARHYAARREQVRAWLAHVEPPADFRARLVATIEAAEADARHRAEQAAAAAARARRQAERQRLIEQQRAEHQRQQATIDRAKERGRARRGALESGAPKAGARRPSSWATIGLAVLLAAIFVRWLQGPAPARLHRQSDDPAHDHQVDRYAIEQRKS